MSKLFMMIGLPGSGKSYQAKILSEKEDAKIFSSDDYRIKLHLDFEEFDKESNRELFFNLEVDLVNCLADNKNAIFDACNLNSKKRRNLLNNVKYLGCEKIAVLVLRKIDRCIKANYERDRHVPEDIIRKYYKSFQVPYLEEGFDRIEVIYTDNDENSIPEDDYITKYYDYDQNSKFHEYTLGLHSLFTYLYCKIHFEADLELFKAAFLHDIGKPFCRTELTYKGFKDGYSHYYGHDSVGAYESLFIKYNEPVDKLLIAFIINNHMRPLTWKGSQKAMKNDREKWRDLKFNLILKLNEADSNSH